MSTLPTTTETLQALRETRAKIPCFLGRLWELPHYCESQIALEVSSKKWPIPKQLFHRQLGCIDTAHSPRRSSSLCESQKAPRSFLRQWDRAQEAASHGSICAVYKASRDVPSLPVESRNSQGWLLESRKDYPTPMSLRTDVIS